MRTILKVNLLLLVVALFFIIIEWNNVFLYFKCFRDPGGREYFLQGSSLEEIITIGYKETLWRIALIAISILILITINIIILYKNRISRTDKGKKNTDPIKLHLK